MYRKLSPEQSLARALAAYRRARRNLRHARRAYRIACDATSAACDRRASLRTFSTATAVRRALCDERHAERAMRQRQRIANACWACAYVILATHGQR